MPPLSCGDFLERCVQHALLMLALLHVVLQRLLAKPRRISTILLIALLQPLLHGFHIGHLLFPLGLKKSGRSTGFAHSGDP